MTINIETSVRNLALSVPNATRVFEQMGIDYCCGGNQSLAAACENAKIPVAMVIESLEHSSNTVSSNGAAQDWQAASLRELINHIVETHHSFTRRELARVEKLSEKVLSAHGKNHPWLLNLDELVRSLGQDLNLHMLKEEQALFPYVNALEEAVTNNRPAPTPFFVTVQNPVRMMMMEHDKAGDILRDIRKVTNGFTLPADACITFGTLYQALQELEADLHQHIHLENNILFPRAIEIEGAPALNGGQEYGHGHSCFGH